MLLLICSYYKWDLLFNIITENVNILNILFYYGRIHKKMYHPKWTICVYGSVALSTLTLLRTIRTIYLSNWILMTSLVFAYPFSKWSLLSYWFWHIFTDSEVVQMDQLFSKATRSTAGRGSGTPESMQCLAQSTKTKRLSQLSDVLSELMGWNRCF